MDGVASARDNPVQYKGEQYLFYAETKKGGGCSIRWVIDHLASTLTGRAGFVITSDGIELREMNASQSCLVNMWLDSSKFRVYRCDEDSVYKIHVSLKNLQRIMRNVKKKSSVTWYIKAAEPSVLYIINVPSTDNGGVRRVERNGIQFHRDHERIQLIDMSGMVDYMRPVIVDSANFQAIKKLTSLDSNNRTISITIRGNATISFKSDTGIISSEIVFGDEADDTFEPYTGEFDATTVGQLNKILGLSHQVEFYAPVPGKCLPIKIRSDVDTLGFFEVYIKDEAQIEFENTNDNLEIIK